MYHFCFVVVVKDIFHIHLGQSLSSDGSLPVAWLAMCNCNLLPSIIIIILDFLVTRSYLCTPSCQLIIHITYLSTFFESIIFIGICFNFLCTLYCLRELVLYTIDMHYFCRPLVNCAIYLPWMLSINIYIYIWILIKIWLTNFIPFVLELQSTSFVHFNCSLFLQKYISENMVWIILLINFQLLMSSPTYYKWSRGNDWLLTNLWLIYGFRTISVGVTSGSLRRRLEYAT